MRRKETWSKVARPFHIVPISYSSVLCKQFTKTDVRTLQICLSQPTPEQLQIFLGKVHTTSCTHFRTSSTIAKETGVSCSNPAEQHIVFAPIALKGYWSSLFFVQCPLWARILVAETLSCTVALPPARLSCRPVAARHSPPQVETRSNAR